MPSRSSRPLHASEGACHQLEVPVEAVGELSRQRPAAGDDPVGEVDSQIAGPAGLDRGRDDLGDLVVQGAAHVAGEELAAGPGGVPLHNPIDAVDGVAHEPVADGVEPRPLLVAVREVLQGGKKGYH